MTTNGTHLPDRTANKEAPLQRAQELDELIDAVKALVVPFVQAADDDAQTKSTGHGLQTSGQGPRTALVEHHPPHKLDSLLGVSLPEQGEGKDGLLEAVKSILQYSVNTWDQGFVDKLYGSTNAVGVVTEMLLGVLNTNVAPALTLIEKRTTAKLASLFGFNGPHAGGVSQPGGSAGNQSSVVMARNILHPETKTDGNGSKKFVLFTSVHGHYSLEKAAQMFGFGSNSVRSIAVDDQGRMRVDALEQEIEKALSAGETPFYVNATAGTTVLGSYDPIDKIASVCQKHKLWLHVDGSWGGPVIFSEKYKHKLKGCEKADSIVVSPHKMMGAPMTCSFLLVKDLRQLHKAMTLPAKYLFHSEDDLSSSNQIWDLADLTPQCGRRGDSLKLALNWIHTGSQGFEKRIDRAFDTASYLAEQVSSNPDFHLVSSNPPPCLQVCFYYGRDNSREKNSLRTQKIAQALVPKGFMVDYAPGEDGQFFRVVVNGDTLRTTCDGLVKAISDIGKSVKV